MLLVAHHIAWDDGCWRVFFTDLTRAYRGEDLGPAAPAPAPAMTAADADLDYWRSVLADPPEPLELPGPNGSAVPTNWRSQRTTLALPDQTVDRVAALAKESGATPYMVLLAAFGVLMHRYTHADDFLVATPVLNRGAGLEDVIGYYGNTVALRLRPQPRQTFREMVTHARDTAVGAFAHQQVNLDRVVRELNPDRRHGVERMTRVTFGARGADGDGFNPPGITCERAELRGQFTQLPLGFMVEFDAPEPRSWWRPSTSSRSSTRALVGQLLTHLRRAAGRRAGQSRPADRQARPDGPPPTPTGCAGYRPVRNSPPRQRTLAALVEAQVARTPDGVAMVYEGRNYTYREVNESANRFAHWLIEHGIGTEDRVAVLLDRSPELVITALGVIKAGAVYLPVDPTYPEDRLSFILSDSEPKLVLREAVDGSGRLPRGQPHRRRPGPPAAIPTTPPI